MDDVTIGSNLVNPRIDETPGADEPAIVLLVLCPHTSLGLRRYMIHSCSIIMLIRLVKISDCSLRLRQDLTWVKVVQETLGCIASLVRWQN